MRLLLCSLLFASLFSAGWSRADEPDQTIEQFREEVIALLSKIDTDPKKAKENEKQMRVGLVKLIDKHAAKLRPNEGFKEYVSKDKTLVLLIGANGHQEKDGKFPQALSVKAKIVIAIGGNGIAAKDGKKATRGNDAMAISPTSIAIAVGGNGGDGAAGIGEGEEGGTAAAFGNGVITLSGNSGLKETGELGGAGKISIEQQDAIVKTIKELVKK